MSVGEPLAPVFAPYLTDGTFIGGSRLQLAVELVA